MTEDPAYRHDTALVESRAIGPGTRIWAFTHIMAGATIGAHCNICDHCFVEAGAVIGDHVTLKNGVAVWDHVTLEDGVFVGPNATFTNDRRPRSGNPRWQAQKTVVGSGASIGANATILCGIRIGTFAMIGAGAVVTADVPDHALTYGNPARVCGWVCTCAARLTFAGSAATCSQCGRRYRQSAERVELVSANDTDGR
jgi:acetyltransferase-like isoleucine patch superfamily enzyme